MQRQRMSGRRQCVTASTRLAGRQDIWTGREGGSGQLRLAGLGSVRESDVIGRVLEATRVQWGIVVRANSE